MTRFLSTFVCAVLLTAGCGSNPAGPDISFPVTLTLKAGQSTTTGAVALGQVGRLPRGAVADAGVVEWGGVRRLTQHTGAR